MNWFWIGLGIVLICAGLLDLFLSALNYDESGMITLRLQEWLWLALRAVFRRLPQRWNRIGRAQVVGLQVVMNFIAWVALVTIGFGFIYYGLMYDHTFTFSGSHIGRSMDYAIYFSVAQFSTVGATSMTPQTTLLRVLGVVETLIGLGLVTLAISFLISVFQTLTFLQALSSDLYLAASQDAGDPLAILALYFPHGQPKGLSDFLGRLYQNLGSYYSGLRLHHTAYYYQSRNPHISIPYTVQILGGVIAALRWGLPADSPAADEPLLTLLANQFTTFESYLDSRLQRQAADPPPAQPYQAFAGAYATGQGTGDTWLDRFLAMDRRMRRMAQMDQPPDPREAYQRYTEWLPFAYRAQRAEESIAHHLGYERSKEAYQSHD